MVVEALELPLSAEQFHDELYSSLSELFPNAQMMPGKPRCGNETPAVYCIVQNYGKFLSAKKMALHF